MHWPPRLVPGLAALAPHPLALLPPLAVLANLFPTWPRLPLTPALSLRHRLGVGGRTSPTPRMFRCFLAAAPGHGSTRTSGRQAHSCQATGIGHGVAAARRLFSGNRPSHGFRPPANLRSAPSPLTNAAPRRTGATFTRPRLGRGCGSGHFWLKRMGANAWRGYGVPTITALRLQLQMRLVLPSRTTSIQRSYEFGLLVGLDET